MKKFVTVLAVIVGLLSIAPISLALNNINNKKIDTMYVDAPKVSLPEKSLTEVEENDEVSYLEEEHNNPSKTSTNNDLITKENQSIEKNLTNKSIKKDVISSKHINKINSSIDTKNIDELSDNSTDKITDEKDEILSEINSKSEMKYSYAGNEKEFNVLNEKGHEGYVFSPNGYSDLGVFVDKNTKEKFYFHPSGYMEAYE